MVGTPAESFIEAQAAALRRYGIDAEECFIDAPAVAGRAHVLVAGDGPPVVMVNGTQSRRSFGHGR